MPTTTTAYQITFHLLYKSISSAYIDGIHTLLWCYLYRVFRK